MRVEVVVEDPGDAPLHYQYVCRWPDEGSHAWQIVNLDDHGSVWFCFKCRRVEQRILHRD